MPSKLWECSVEGTIRESLNSSGINGKDHYTEGWRKLQDSYLLLETRLFSFNSPNLVSQNITFPPELSIAEYLRSKFWKQTLKMTS